MWRMKLNNIYIPLTKPITALPAFRPSISPISMGTELPEEEEKKKRNYFLSG
jgi:hypothetical protein